MFNHNFADNTLNNSTIINFLVCDLCTNSSPEKGLCFSPEAFDLLNKIKDFNYKHIYFSDKLKNSLPYFELVLTEIYSKLKNCFDSNNTLSNLHKLQRTYPKLITGFCSFLDNYCAYARTPENKLANKIIFDISNQRDYFKAILSYISGMTDNYAIELYNEIIRF